MKPTHAVLSVPAVVVIVLAFCAGTAAAAPPGEVTGDTLSASSTLAWSPVAGADEYNVYRGSISWLASASGAQCHGAAIAATSFSSPVNPAAGQGYFYLVTAESILNGEGTPGSDSHGSPRPLRGACAKVVRNHVLNRTGYGWNEWARDRMAALGIRGYIDEQLNPASIDESTNTDLNTRRAALVPPVTINEIQGLDLVNAVYARRQLEQQ